MNEIITSLAFLFFGSLFSALMVWTLVAGYNWKVQKALWVAPFGFIILPLFFLVAFPIMMLGEIFQSVGNKFVAIGRK